MRLLRRFAPIVAAIGLSLAGTGLIVVITQTRASADESCVQRGGQWLCRWTQLSNNNWPNDTGDPDCHSYCAYYLHGGGPQNYDYSNNTSTPSGGSVQFHDDMNQAVRAWSGQPYNSPWFGDCQCSSGAFMTITAAPDNTQTGGGLCGVGYVTTAWQAYGATGDNHIVSAYANYATDSGDTWFDGPPPSDGSFQGSYCDAQAVAFHEVGHAFGEGHSTYAADVMYYGGGDTAAIDADAQNMLNAVYGPYQGGNGSGGGTGCGGCQVVCTLDLCAPGCSSPQGNAECIVEGYLAKAWNLSQGVTLPNPVSYVSPPPSGCLVYWYAKEPVQWIECAKANLT